MGRNKRHRSQKGVGSPSRELTLHELDTLEEKIRIEKELLIQKSLQSDDPYSIMQAARYLKEKQSSSDEIKSFLFDPNISSLNVNNYRVPYKDISYDTLRKMGRTPVIRTVISTRVDQVANFSEAVDSEQEEGWMIRRKKSLWDKGDEKLNREDKKTIEYITRFINEGGITQNRWDFDSFEDYLRMITYDSLTIDQACIEFCNNVRGKLVQYLPIDGSTIRLVDIGQEDNLRKYYKEIDGYLPKYLQVYQDQVYTAYYPWEMCMGVRNKTTDIHANGYGVSELEDMVNVVTWLLYGMQYNGNFFSQGSNPKGFFSIEGNVPPNALNDFKQMWRNTIVGVQNSHKTPVIESGNAKINWIDMQTTNKDMEFDNWLEFLIVISCCMFRIDPTECGFNLKKTGNQVFGQDGQKARLKHSQSKGLTPILKMEQRLFTKYIVERIDPDFEFIFCGVKTEDQQLSLDMDVKKVNNGFMSLEDGFKKWSNREFDPEKDTILNSMYQQIQQAKQMGGGMMNGIVGQEGASGVEGGTGEESDNPFEKSLLNYIERGLR